MNPGNDNLHERTRLKCWAQKIATLKKWSCMAAVCIGKYIYTFGRVVVARNSSQLCQLPYSSAEYQRSLVEVRKYDLTRRAWSHTEWTAENAIDIPNFVCRGFSCGKKAILLDLDSNQRSNITRFYVFDTECHRWSSFPIDLPAVQPPQREPLCVLNDVIYDSYGFNSTGGGASRSFVWELSFDHRCWLTRFESDSVVFNSAADDTYVSVAYQDLILSFGVQSSRRINGRECTKLGSSVMLYSPKAGTQRSTPTKGAPPYLEKPCDVLSHDQQIYAFREDVMYRFDPNSCEWKSSEIAGILHRQHDVLGTYLSTPFGICYVAFDQTIVDHPKVDIYQINLDVPPLQAFCATARRRFHPDADLSSLQLRPTFY